MNNSREKRLALIAGAVVGVLVFDQFILQPMIRGWSARAERISELSQQVQRGKSLLQRREAIENRWAQMRTDALPLSRSESETRVVDGMLRWQQSSRATVTSVKPDWRDVDEVYDLLEVRMAIEGGLREIVEFVHAMESDRLPVRMDRIELVKNDASGRRFQVTVVMTALRFLQSDS